MDQGTYEITALEKKYDRFLSPQIKIVLGGEKLNPTQIPITSLTVELSAEGAAGGCSFTVESLYDYEKQAWKKDLADKVKAGASLEIFGGYKNDSTVKPIFYGYVDDYVMLHSNQGAPQIVVNGIDGFGYLMSCREPIHGGEKKSKNIVEEVLNKAKKAGFCKSTTVDTAGSMVSDPYSIPVVKEKISDFRFLNLLAGRYGMTLTGINGELIFDDLWKKTAPIIKLTMGRGLLSFRRRVSLKNQVGKVIIWGKDVNQKFIEGAADSVTLSGKGKSAAQLVPALKDSVRREYSEYVRTAEECKYLAQVRLNKLSTELVFGDGMCIGIPELIPGRFVTIDGVGDTGGSYFLSKVVHTFSREGYYTRFEVKGAKVP